MKNPYRHLPKKKRIFIYWCLLMALFIALRLTLWAAAAYLSESFEATKPANGGYDNAGWSETIGGGCTIDPDNTDIAPPTGGGSQILKIVGAGNGVNNNTLYDLGGDRADTWTSVGFRLAALNDGANGQFVKTEDTAYNNTWTINVHRSGSTYTMKISVYYDGATQNNIDSKVISLDTWYQVDVKYDVANTAWEWKVDGIQEGSGALSGSLTGGIRRFYIYNMAWSDGFAATAYFDRIWIDDNEYGYGEAPPAGYIPKVIFIR